MNLRRRYWALAASAIFTLAGLNSCKDMSSDLPLPDVYTQTLFVSSNNQIVYAVDPVSGNRKWKLAVDGEVHATPVLHTGALWISTTAGTLYKLNQQYGTEIIKRTFGGGIVGTPLGYGKGMLLVVSGNTLHAIDVNTLADVWTYDAGSPVLTSPTSHRIAGIQDNAIFISTTGNKVIALDPLGALLWEFIPSTNGAFYSSPCVVNDSFLYVGNDNGYMYSVKTQDGSEKWRFLTDGQIKSSPIHIGGNVMFGSNDRTFYSVDSSTGQLRWKVKTNDIIQSSPSVYNQYVYFGSYDGSIYCIDIIDGKVKWKSLTFGLIKSSPLLYRGDVYFGSFDKNLYRLDANDGSQKFVFNVNGQMECSPIIDSVGGAAVPSISGNYKF
jgi:outer membrane protein assembly factor BamB